MSRAFKESGFWFIDVAELNFTYKCKLSVSPRILKGNIMNPPYFLPAEELLLSCLRSENVHCLFFIACSRVVFRGENCTTFIQCSRKTFSMSQNAKDTRMSCICLLSGYSDSQSSAAFSVWLKHAVSIRLRCFESGCSADWTKCDFDAALVFISCRL